MSFATADKLISESFALKTACSLEAEVAMEEAQALLRRRGWQSCWTEIYYIDIKLRRAGLSEIDPFMIRWNQFIDPLLPAKKKRSRRR